MKSELNHSRYQRQILLKEMGESGQQKLLLAKVLVIGAGGLGCPALQYLAAAGVGHIGIVDFDLVELSNLQRQILFTIVDIGKSKSHTAANKINALNPEIHVQVFNEKIDQTNALNILKDFDLVIDGSDNFATRYAINDACVLLDKPLVYGAVLAFEGQLAVFNLPDPKTKVSTNYRDLFPDLHKASQTISCNEVGVLGVVPGLIGTLMAAEAIKIICGIGEVLLNKVITYSVLTNQFYELELNPTKTKWSGPKNAEEFLKYDYEFHCSGGDLKEEINLSQFEIVRKQKGTLLLDVRESGEIPLVTEFEHIGIPLSQLEDRWKEIPMKDTLIVFCNSGQRSLKAVSLLKEKFPTFKVLSLKEGISKWKNDHHE